ncbi:hypothetical protein BDW22DRAFT_1433759 [Trametopsis cervina]|nr:hypothetical protein BDW22DRAFT_1433759 [Trametopsis cervina]
MPWAYWEYSDSTLPLPGEHDYASAWEWLRNMANLVADRQLDSDDISDIVLGVAMLYRKAHEEWFDRSSPSDDGPVDILKVLCNLTINEATDILQNAVLLLGKSKTARPSKSQTEQNTHTSSSDEDADTEDARPVPESQSEVLPNNPAGNSEEGSDVELERVSLSKKTAPTARAILPPKVSKPKQVRIVSPDRSASETPEESKRTNIGRKKSGKTQALPEQPEIVSESTSDATEPEETIKTTRRKTNTPRDPPPVRKLAISNDPASDATEPDEVHQEARPKKQSKNAPLPAKKRQDKTTKRASPPEKASEHTTKPPSSKGISFGAPTCRGRVPTVTARAKQSTISR